jgi:hypothetical protein
MFVSASSQQFGVVLSANFSAIKIFVNPHDRESKKQEHETKGYI